MERHISHKPQNAGVVTAIIVNFGTPEYMEPLVSNLIDRGIHIIVADNSPATTPESVKLSTDTYQYIGNSSNVGFGTAANIAAKQVTTEWLLVLNPDVTLSVEDIMRLVDRAKEKNWDACSPDTKDPRYRQPLPSVWWFLAVYTPLKNIAIFKLLAQKMPRTLWGGCILVRREVFMALGGFDERFFLWFEDSDFTRRLINGGYKIGFVDIPSIRHTGGASFAHLTTQEMRTIFFTSAYTYARIHGSFIQRLLVFLLRWYYGR